MEQNIDRDALNRLNLQTGMESHRRIMDQADYLLEQLGRAIAMPNADAKEQAERIDSLFGKLSATTLHFDNERIISILSRAFVIVKDNSPEVAERIIKGVRAYGSDPEVVLNPS